MGLWYTKLSLDVRNTHFSQLFSDPGEKRIGTLFGAWTIFSEAAAKKKGQRIGATDFG